MNCTTFRKYITDFVDGATSAELSDQLNDHMAGCPSCAKLHRAHAMIAESFGSTGTVKAPSSLADRIMAGVGEKAAAPEPKRAVTVTVNCPDFESNIGSYLDGLISGGLVAAMDRHRAECPGCNQLAMVHESLVTALDRTETVKAPAGLAERILLAAAKEETARIPLLKRFELGVASLTAVASVGAVAAMVVGALTGVFGGAGNPAVGFDGILAQLQALPLLMEAWLVAHLPADTINTFYSLGSAFDFSPSGIPLYPVIPGAMLLAASCLYYLRMRSTTVMPEATVK